MRVLNVCLSGAVVDAFRDLASSCGVPDVVADILQQSGWSVTLFSCWVASAAEVSTEASKLGLPADLEDNPLLIASLRALWKACLAACDAKGLSSTGVSASVSSSWADNFPPRMPADELQQQAFLQFEVSKRNFGQRFHAWTTHVGLTEKEFFS